MRENTCKVVANTPDLTSPTAQCTISSTAADCTGSSKSTVRAYSAEVPSGEVASVSSVIYKMYALSTHERCTSAQ